LGPREKCAICKKTLTDQTSVSRGVGPECWSHIVTIQARLQGQGQLFLPFQDEHTTPKQPAEA
jgi:hypothetical protein